MKFASLNRFTYRWIGLFTILVYLILYLQGNHPLWKGHLEVDTWVWYQRLDYFRTHASFLGLRDSEFLPATLLFLFLPAAFFRLPVLDYGHYLQGVFLVNTLILLLQVLLIGRKSSGWQTMLFLLLLLAFGPIVFFRFDSTVTLLVLAGWFLWKRQRYFFSGLSFGSSIAMKIFPIIFLPYLYLVLTRERRLTSGFSFLAGILIALIVPVLWFFSLGGDGQQLKEILAFHSLKPVSIESLPGSILTGLSWLTQGSPPALLGGYGVWGIRSPITQALGRAFFNWAWVVPVLLVYLYLFTQRRLTRQVTPGVLFTLTLVFLLFSKNLNPQYLLWFLVFFPFLRLKANGLPAYALLFLLLFFAAFLNQLVYPLLYTSFLEDFYQLGQLPESFYLQLMRNLALVGAAGVAVKSILVERKLI
jgi:hypothetical protein